MFIEDRIKEAEKQREGLALASLFAKPRPVWSAQPFYCFFGDDFVGMYCTILYYHSVYDAFYNVILILYNM